MFMSCNDIDRQLDSMLDGALDQETERTVKAHLSFCPICESKWERLEGLRSLLRNVATSAPSASLESRVMSAFYNKHSSATSGWTRLSLLSFLRDPAKPLFATILVGVVVAALAGAFLLGRVTATQIVMPALPALTVSLPNAPPSKTPESGVARRESASFRTVAARSRSRQPVHRTANVDSMARTSTMNPFESFTTVSSSGTNYSTTAQLDGFEPLKDTKVRVVKGEE
jgi:anti-sigma factor RsiW